MDRAKERGKRKDGYAEFVAGRSAAQSPQDFIPVPDDGLGYGEITPEMGKKMRRQAGKIRLRRGDGKQEPAGLQACIRTNTIDAMQVETTAPFEAWLGDLKDRVTRLRLLRRLDKAGRGLLGDVQPVGEGVMEMREFFGPGWRMYYVQRGQVLIVMLGGGDKSTQQADIAAAIALSQTLPETKS